MFRGLAAAAIAGFVAACASFATSSGDASRGWTVVEKWCSFCHNVGTNRDKATAPSFAEIARRPGRDAVYLRNFIHEDHFPMTMHRLFEQERDDVLAYLVSLRRDAQAQERDATSESR